MVMFQLRERLIHGDEADPLKPRSKRSTVPNDSLTEALLESNTAVDGSLEDGEQKWWEN